MTAPVVPLRAAGDSPAAVREALAAVSRHLDRCKLSARTVRAYKRQAAAYADWLTRNVSAHGDAFADLADAEGAVTAWKRDMLSARSSPATVNQALLGHASIDTAARYFRAGPAENAAVIERIFDQ